MPPSTVTRTEQRRAEIRSRFALIAAAALFLVGAVVFFQTRADTVAPTPASKEQLAQPDPEPTSVLGKTGGTLVPAARKAAGQFLLSALRRQNLAVSWELAAPDLRNAVTRKQWLAGEMPFPPFPVRSLATTGFQVMTAKPDEVLLQVLVLPPVGDEDYEPIRYDMTLEKHDGRWLVSYLVPYAPIPVQKDG